MLVVGVLSFHSPLSLAHILTRILCSYLRTDALSQLLAMTNTHAKSNMIVMETCQGLVAGAMLERMGGKEGRTLERGHLQSGYPWDLPKCPDQRGGLISVVDLDLYCL